MPRPPVPQLAPVDEPRQAALWDGLLAGFDELRLQVRGGCMRPELHAGDGVRLWPLRRRRPRFGDVVLARTSHGLRLHRLVWPPWPHPAAPARLMADRARSLDARLAGDALLAVAVTVEGDGAQRSLRRPGLAWRLLARAVCTRLVRLWPRRGARP